MNGTSTIPGRLLLDPAVLDDPYPFYLRLREEAPVWRMPGTEVFVITGYAQLEQAARRVEDFSSKMHRLLFKRRSGIPARLPSVGFQVLATADPPVHAQHKAAAFSGGVSRRMAELAPEIEQVAGEHLAAALGEGKVEFMSAVANPVPIRVVSRLIGFRNANPDALMQAAFDSTSVVGAAAGLLGLLKYMGRAALTLRGLTREFASAEAADDSVIGSLKQAEAAKTLSTREAIGVLHILLAAGGESTTSLIGNAVRILAENAALQDELRAQPDLIPKFLEEVLRLESPFRFHLRCASRDTVLNDVAIPAGATVLLFWSAANRDAAIFERPDEIDLRRPTRHVAFGKGIHTCIGAPLARAEARIIIRLLLERTRSITLDPDRTPQWVESLQVRRYEKLPLCWIPN